MNVIELDTGNARQVRQFLSLPYRIYRDVPQWVPPLSFEAARQLDRRRNPFFHHSEAAFWLAVEGGETVGRLAALNPCRYNEYNHTRQAFFYLFECVNNPDVSAGLFATASRWAAERGLEVISGPKGFSALDGLGLLIRGFEHRPAFGIPYNRDYYPSLIEAAGFQPTGEIVSGYISRSTAFPQKIHEVAARVQERRGLRVARFNRRSELKALLPGLKAMYNEAIQGTPGNVPLTDEEVQAIANQLLWFADPRLIKIILKADRPVGFLFAYPDISAALQRSRGRLLPFGWLDMLLEMKRSTWVNLNGAGIVEEYRGMGGTALLFSEMQKTLLESSFQYAEIVQIGAENERMLRELRSIGVDFYKAHGMYEKRLV